MAEIGVIPVLVNNIPSQITLRQYKSATTDGPRPNFSTHRISLQAPWNINPNSVTVPAGSILMTDTTLAAGSLLPAGFPLPANTPLQTVTTVPYDIDASAPGTIIRQGSILKAVSVINGTQTGGLPTAVTTTTAQVVEPNSDVGFITLPGPGEIPFDVLLPDDGGVSAIPADITTPPGYVTDAPLILPGGTTIPAGTPLAVIPEGTTVDPAATNPLTVPAGSTFTTPTLSLDSFSSAVGQGVVPPGTRFEAGYGSSQTNLVLPGDLVVSPDLVGISPLVVAEGSTFTVNSVLPFTSTSTQSFVAVASFTTDALSAPLSSDAVLFPGSTIAMWSQLCRGVTLPYGNTRPIKLFQRRNGVPDIYYDGCYVRGQNDDSSSNAPRTERDVSAFRSNPRCSGPKGLNLYDLGKTPQVVVPSVELVLSTPKVGCIGNQQEGTTFRPEECPIPFSAAFPLQPEDDMGETGEVPEI